ncbi:unnamed protein product [Vicia faba]|uniref:Uncharacterized protein n=1 Tax=Vicia faba TaxID=3906 RepID=A0AAV1AIZ7_VICFA|nr:unnamed protein product [Vicia faba]
MDSLSSRKIHNLNETVKSMVAAGYKKECYDVYSSWRKVFLKVCLNSSGTVKNRPEPIKCFTSKICCKSNKTEIPFQYRPLQKGPCDQLAQLIGGQNQYPSSPVSLDRSTWAVPHSRQFEPQEIIYRTKKILLISKQVMN